MILNDNIGKYPLSGTLFVFALESEAGNEFAGMNKLITGIGKVNAAIELTKAINISRPQLIVNLGSAGSSLFRQGEVVCCTRFVQRDMNVCGLGYLMYETPLSGIPPVMEYGLKLEEIPEGICGTGDSFEMQHNKTEYNVIDMEAYPLALIAMKERIPFLCLKYITDGADGSAAENWTDQVQKVSKVFSEILLHKKICF